MPVSSSTEHWIKPDALTINLNHFGDPDYLQVSVLAGAVVMAFKQDVIGYNAAHNYRTWPLEAANTYLETTSAYNVYARLTRSEVNARALVVYDTVLRDIEGREITYAEDGSEVLGDANSDYFFVFLGQISASVNSNGESVQREWIADFRFGSLETNQQKNDYYGAFEKMFRPHYDDPLNPDRITWIEALSHLGVVGGVTMYVDNGKIDLPSIYAGLPIDGKTIYWENGVLKALYSPGGGEADSVAWNNIKDIPSWITNTKPTYDYSEIQGTPDLSKYALVSQIPSLDGYATESWVTNKGYATESWVLGKGYATPSDIDARIDALINGAPSAFDTLKEIADVLQGNVNSIGNIITALGTKAEKATTLSGYGITDAYTKTAVNDLLKGYVTIAGTEDVTGLHDFVKGLKVGGIKLYKSQDDVIYIEGNLAVRGGVTMYAGTSGLDVEGIYDGLPIDGTTIYWENGVLKARGGGGGVADSVAWADITGKPSFATVATSGSYNDLLNKPTLLSSFTNDLGFVTESALSGKYLPITGGTLTGDLGLAYNSSNNSSKGIRFQKDGSSHLYLYRNESDLYFDGGGAYYKILRSDNYTTYTYSKSDIDSKLSGYLPLSGGTITGVLTIKTGGDAKLILDNTDADDKYTRISFRQNGVEYGQLATYFDSNLQWNNQYVLTAANYSSYALPLTGGTLSGALGVNTSASPSIVQYYVGGTYYGALGFSAANSPIFRNTSGTNNILYHSGNLTKLSQLTNDSGFITSSASITGNAATATKLATARTIWGQSFDGSGNVNGSLYINNNNYIHVKDTGGTSRPLLGLNDYNNFIIGNGSAIAGCNTHIYGNNIYFRYGTSSGYGMMLNSSGNVGIGTTNPEYKLDVNGSLNATTIYQNGSSLSSLLGNYLPLSGGTITNTNETPLIISSSSGYSSIRLSNKNNHRTFGIKADGDLFVTDLSAWNNEYVIFHSGNLTAADILYRIKQVDGSGSGLDADTVDGVHLMGKGGRSGIMRSWARGTYTTSKQYFGNGNVVVIDPKPTDDSNLWANTTIFSLGDMETRSHQLAFGYAEDKLLYRRVDEGPTYNSWKTIAFTDSNVASATKLQTARTIWGQSFDGTGNVSGNLSNVGNITTNSSNKDIYLQQSTDSRSWWTGIGVSSGDDKYVIYDATAKQHRLSIDTSGKVGIGTTSPSHKLHVEGSVRATYFQAGDSSYNAGTIELYGSTSFIDFHYGRSTADYTTRLIEGLSGQLTCTGKFRIGLNYTTSTDYNFYVSGSAYISSNLLTGGGITMYSARVLKNVIDERGLSLRELSVIKPTRYTWKDKRDERLHIGGIADDIQQVLPEVVYRTPDGILTMDYGNAAFAIASSLIQPVISHEERIARLERENRALKEEVKRLKSA